MSDAIIQSTEEDKERMVSIAFSSSKSSLQNCILSSTIWLCAAFSYSPSSSPSLHERGREPRPSNPLRLHFHPACTRGWRANHNHSQSPKRACARTALHYTMTHIDQHHCFVKYSPTRIAPLHNCSPTCAMSVFSFDRIRIVR